MKSISRQLNVGVIGSLLIVGIAISQTAVWLFDSSMRDFMASNLRDDARSLLKAVKRGPNGLILDSARIDPAYHQPLSGRYFVITIEGQRWRSRSLWDVQASQLDAPGMSEELVEGPAKQRLLWLRTNYERYGQDIRILVATDYSPILRDFRHIEYLGLAFWGIALLVLALLQRYLMRRALRPLDAARAQVEQLRTGARAALSEEVPLELEPLVHEINRLLQHTQHMLQRSRTALGNLSHSLKTPLAVLGTLTERSPIRNDKKLYDSFTAQLEQMRHLVTRELAKARTAGTLESANLFNVDEDIPLLIESLQRTHQNTIVFESDVSLHGRLPWEREDILEVLGNLLDNAYKWARQTVTLRIRHEDDFLVIQVSDDGPGIAHDEIEHALQRGTRLDENTEGHGLGLAIVSDKVSAYQGTLDLEQSQQGGLRVRIRLPWPTRRHG